MHWAAFNGHADVVQLLASHGANVNAANTVLSTVIEIGLTARAYCYLWCFKFVCL